MLNRIIDLTLAYRWLVLVAVLALLGAGGYALYTIPVEAFPDLTNNQVVVVTNAPSLPPTEVEQLVTYPIERAMLGLPNKEEVRSLSKLGLSMVTIVFDDAVPMYLIFQPTNTAYGVGLNPLNLKWNFEQRGRFVPYTELSGGVLFTTHDVPPNTSEINFTPSAAFGFHYLGERFAWTLEGRYLHISDAGLSRLNPGVNTFEVRIGVGKFRK